MEEWTSLLVAYLYTLKYLCHILSPLLNSLVTIPLSHGHRQASLSLQMFSAVNLGGSYKVLWLRLVEGKVFTCFINNLPRFFCLGLINVRNVSGRMTVLSTQVVQPKMVVAMVCGHRQV